MAQGFTNGSTKPPPNPDVMDIDGPFEAPPSTLAAKLVNNLSNTRKPTLQRSRTIDQLAIEIQKFESLPVEEKIGPKLVAHNRRTIFVLTKEILDDLSLSNVKLDETYVEASEKAELVLDALEDAIRQTPSVLLETQGDDDLITTGRAVPLWLWLCPRLLRLTSKYTSENDWCEKIGNFFYSIFEVTEDANNELWGLSRTLITYFRHCVGAAINSVHLKTAVVLPLPSFEDEISLAGNPDFLAHGCSYPVLGGVEATVHAEFLLQLLIRLLCLHRAEVSVAAGTSELEELAIWVFESFLKLRKTYMHTELSFDDEYHRDRLGQDLNSLYQFLVVLKCHPTGVLICRGYEASCFLLEEYVKEDQDNIESKHMSKKSFCSLLLDIAAACRDFEPIKSEVRTRLLFALADLPVIRGATGNLAESEIDSQLATCIRILDRICEASIVEVDDNDQLELVDSHLLSQMASCKLDLKAQIFRNDGREEGESAKRKKLATNTEGDRLLVYYDKITSNLNHVQNGEDDRSSPSESIYVAGFQVVGYLACAYSSSLSAFWDRSGQLDYAECSVCDALGLSSLDETAVGHSESKTDSSAQVVIHSFRQTMSMGTFEQQEQARVAGMIALRRLAMHIDTKDFLDLEKSDLAKWCFASLTSKSRELRIAAGRTLPVFLHDRKCTDVIQRNRILALDGLKQLSDSSPMHFTETLVLAFGQLARVLRNRDLNFVLLRLIQYLGHPHQIVAAAAASEIMSAASAHGVSLRTLFAPFWRTMAYETVKDCQTRPQIAQSVAELLDMTVDELLGSTQAHTLPWLVLHNEKDAIRRISRARGDPDDYEVIVQNLGTIIPRLLVQNQEDLGGYVVKVIGSYSLKFEHSDYTGWLRSAAIMIASELLKLAGEDGGERNNRVRDTLSLSPSRC